jgi:hypothetical protein
MTDSKLHDWGQVIGALAVVASLIFVGLEVRQQGEAANEEGISNDLANLIAVEELVTANPGIWLRGCQGETLSPDEQMVYTHIYHSYEFLYFMRWLRGKKGVHESTEGLAIDNFAMALYRYPGIQLEWERHGKTRHQVSDEVTFHQWRKMVEQRAAEYPSFEPDPIADPYRCGLN